MISSFVPKRMGWLAYEGEKLATFLRQLLVRWTSGEIAIVSRNQPHSMRIVSRKPPGYT